MAKVRRRRPSDSDTSCVAEYGIDACEQHWIVYGAPLDLQPQFPVAMDELHLSCILEKGGTLRGAQVFGGMRERVAFAFGISSAASARSGGTRRSMSRVSLMSSDP